MINIFEQQEIISKAEAIKENFKVSTWCELETKLTQEEENLASRGLHLATALRDFRV